MRTTNDSVRAGLHSIEGMATSVRLRYSLILPIAMAVWATSATSNAQTVTTTTTSNSQTQTVIGSPGAGFQHWTAANLNNNGAPFWDAPTLSFGNYSGNQDSKNVGFCLTGGGDCVGIGSQSAPGPLAFWGLPYNSSLDTGGALDTKVYIHGSGSQTLRATLELQLSTVPTEVNDIGWFETNATGSVVGTLHPLFKGSPTPDPVGATVNFKPTPYFGYYFSDYSEGNCKAYTLYSFNDTSGCYTHPLVVFASNPGSPQPVFWIAAIDPPGCGDGDCNLTLINVSPSSSYGGH